MNPNDSSQRLAPRVLLAAMAAIFLYLVFRNSGLGPSVLGDEWSYSRDSRLLPFSQADIPSYFYFLIYRSTTMCGMDFADCARVLNAGFFVMAGPFMFLVARRCMHRGLAVWLTVAVLLSPFSAYTAFFMPEAMYFFLFWVLAWLVLVAAPRPTARTGLMTGCLLGAMCLVKLHAIFLLGGYGLYLLLLMTLTRGKWAWYASCQCMLVAFATFFVVRFGGGYLLAGRDGLHLLGGLYGSQFNHSFSHPAPEQLLHYGAHSAAGHIMALALLCAVPLACLSQLHRLPAIDDPSQESFRQRLLMFSVAILFTLVAVTVYFTANVPDGSPLEALQRLHMRYYSFAVPLLYLVGGAWSGKAQSYERRGSWRPLVAMLLVGGLYVCAWRHHLDGFVPNRIDSPELHGLLASHHFSNVMGALGLACLLFWLISRQLGSILYSLLFLPLFALGASFYVNSETVQRKNPDIYDTSARTARDLLPPSQRMGVVMFGDDIFKLVQANFQLDLPDTRNVVLKTGQSIEIADIPAGGRWALVVGQHAMHAPSVSAQNFGGYALYQLAVPLTIDFRDSRDTLAGAEGLSGVEEFGRWSNADQVVLHLVKPLPASVSLSLTAAAYGPNVGKPFIARLGEEQQTFTLADTAQTIQLQFHNPPGLDLLKISIPAATSPQSLGKSIDNRRLGMALSSIRIVAKP